MLSNNNIYNISFGDLIILNLPTFLRGGRIYHFIMSLISPIVLNHGRFNFWRNSTTYKLQHTGQVIYLEKVLNDFYVDSYDSLNHKNTREIWISDGEQPEQVYLALEIENDPLYVSNSEPVYLGTIDEYENNYSDFTVNVPELIVFDELAMRALVDYYKLAGKIYKINIVA